MQIKGVWATTCSTWWSIKSVQAPLWQRDDSQLFGMKTFHYSDVKQHWPKSKSKWWAEVSCSELYIYRQCLCALRNLKIRGAGPTSCDLSSECTVYMAAQGFLSTMMLCSCTFQVSGCENLQQIWTQPEHAPKLRQCSQTETVYTAHTTQVCWLCQHCVDKLRGPLGLISGNHTQQLIMSLSSFVFSRGVYSNLFSVCKYVFRTSSHRHISLHPIIKMGMTALFREAAECGRSEDTHHQRQRPLPWHHSDQSGEQHLEEKTDAVSKWKQLLTDVHITHIHMMK